MKTADSHATIIIVLATVLAVDTAIAQGFPSKVVRLVVPFPAGGSNDVVARAMSQPLSRALGQSVVVENRPGANTIIGTEVVARAPADGHTVLIVGFTFMANAALRSKLPYDPLKDFAAVTGIGSQPFVLSVHPSLPVKWKLDPEPFGWRALFLRRSSSSSRFLNRLPRCYWRSASPVSEYSAAAKWRNSVSLTERQPVRLPFSFVEGSFCTRELDVGGRQRATRARASRDGARLRRLFGLDTGVFHHFRPFDGFGAEIGRKVLGRAADRVGAIGDEAVPHFRILQRPHRFTMPPVHDGAQRA